MSTVRKAVRAGALYPATAAGIKSEVDTMMKDMEETDLPSVTAVAAVTPHAGWAFSGRIALKTIKLLLDRSEARTVVLFGAVHMWGVPLPTISGADFWETPLGTVPVDSELRDAVAGSGLPVQVDEHAHAGEHSIEVLLPFVQAFSGRVSILPVAVPVTEDAEALGKGLGGMVGPEEGVVALASTDLTHYGPDFYGWAPKGTGREALEWVKEKNDAGIIDLMLRMKSGEIITEAQHSRSACGPGAVAAAVAFAEASGASKGVLVDYATSYDVKPYGEPTDFVGYAGVVFVK